MGSGDLESKALTAAPTPPEPNMAGETCTTRLLDGALLPVKWLPGLRRYGRTSITDLVPPLSFWSFRVIAGGIRSIRTTVASTSNGG